MSKTKKIAVLAIIAMVLTMMPASLFAVDFDGDRLAGDNRIETALAIADAGWDEADVVVLAPADQANLVDALAAAPLAGQENAPILLTFKGTLNADVKAAIADLGASKVYAVGAISDEVVAEVEAIDGVEVEKLSGADRWATAEAINAELDDPAGTFVVGYNAVADAMSVASYAAANGYAIVLADADGSVDEDALVGDVTYIVGGDKLVDDIEGAERIAGDDRFETNADVAEALDFDYDVVYVANGLSLVDALAVAPLAAQDNAFVLLASANDVESIDGISASTQVIAVGGTSAVPNKILDKVYDDEGEFTVKSAKAENLIQIVLELSNDNYYDEDELKDEDNYEFEGEVGDKDNVDVLIDEVVVDGTEVILNLDQAVDNQSVGELTIDKKVTGEEIVFEDIEFFDKDIPSIESVEVIGEDTVKVTFSEPMNFYNGEPKSDSNFAINTDLEDEFDFELDGKSYSVDKLEPTENDTEVNVVVYGSFSEGELTVEIDNGLEDYAGFNIVAETFTLDVEPDDEAPEVTGYKDAEREEVTLIFNESVRLTNDAEEEDFYHTNTNSSNRIDDLDTDVEVDDNEITLTFDDDNELPEGTAYVYIKSGAIEDLWGNENDTIKVKVDVEVDEDAPTVEEVEFEDGDVVITFSEFLDEDTAIDEDNYAVTNVTDDEEIRVNNATYSENDDDEGVVTLSLGDDLDEGDVYEIAICDIEDEAGNTMEDYSIELEYEDEIAPELQGAYLEVDGDEYTIYIEFDEELASEGAYAANDLEKYSLARDGEDYISDLTDDNDDFDAEIDLVDNDKTVKIIIETDDSDYQVQVGDTVRFGRIADAYGNYTDFSNSATIENLESKTIGIEEAKATGKKEIEVTFTSNLDTFEVDDFYVENDASTKLDIESIDVVDSDEIVINLEDKLPADIGTYKLKTIVEDEDEGIEIETENAFGAKLAAGLAVPIDDEIAPSVAEDDNVDTNKIYGQTGWDDGTKDDIPVVVAEYDSATTSSTIYVVFDEPLLAAGINGNTGLVEVNGGDSDVTDVQYASSVVYNGQTLSNVVVITVDGKVYKGDDVEIAVVTDGEGNRTLDISVDIEYEVLGLE